jgi:hypothetical protein
MEQLTFEQLKNIVEDYFSGFFESMEFDQFGEALILTGERRGGIMSELTFNINDYSYFNEHGFLYHKLEDWKGRILTTEQTLKR